MVHSEMQEMANVKEMSSAALRIAVLSGNEAALDEIIARAEQKKDKEKEDAVNAARYDAFMEERASFKCMAYATCRYATAFPPFPRR